MARRLGMTWQCTVCGYVHHGDEPPDFCPQCSAPKEKFIKVDSDEED
jgi:rubrerythrin